jgi:hypothetical protein
MYVLNCGYLNICPSPFNWPSVNLLKSTISSHPNSCAAIGNAIIIAVGGVPTRRAPPANNAPFCIQSCACVRAGVKVLSEKSESKKKMLLLVLSRGTVV